jgi:transcriptional regulator with XRE-family HTH domain
MPLKPSPGFGPRLRAHREERRITLGAVAESIKVKASLLEGLERNDVSGWPPGIYRRALVREYAKAIGLPTEVVLQEFCELFSEPEERQSALVSRHDFATAAGAELRIMFAEASTQTPRLVRRLFGAVAESAGVLAIGYVLTLLTGLGFWTSSGLIALVWYPVTAVIGHDASWHRMLRLQRFRTARLLRTKTTPGAISPAAANLMSVVTTAVGDSAADTLMINDVHASTSASASVH